MNDTLFPLELAAVLSADPYSALAALFTPAPTDDIPAPVPSIFGQQAAAVATRPTLTISGVFDEYGTRRIGTLMLEVRSRLGDETTDREHQTRFLLLMTSLLGAQGADFATTQANQAAAKVALKAALAARGKVTVVDYGPAQNAIEATVDGDDLRTVLSLRMAFAFTPPV